MLSRRALALVTAVILLLATGVTPAPAAPILVCRLSGAVMPALPSPTPDAPPLRPCCLANAPERHTTVLETLETRCCCDLKAAGKAASLSAMLTAAPRSDFAAVLLPALPIALPVLRSAALAAHPRPENVAAPRGPPCLLRFSRGPPLFS
ncbi:MAG: hypothetical protein H7Z41_11250 [Cytophagales bacterium]|nr:hypothetical protein [Armatimonadota bacterium]